MMTDEQIGERADCGVGFAGVFAVHHQRTVQFAFLLCGNPHVAEEVVADAWVGVYRRLERGPITDIGPYLRRAVVNKLRSRARRQLLMRREASGGSAMSAADAMDDEVAARMVVLRALARLPLRMRTAVVLRYYEALSVAETAAIMGIAEGTVKSSVAKGLDRLRLLLEDGDR
ncbi:SigE family RNA polymerase sigma factor [soil metagenome]